MQERFESGTIVQNLIGEVCFGIELDLFSQVDQPFDFDDGVVKVSFPVQKMGFDRRLGIAGHRRKCGAKADIDKSVSGAFWEVNAPPVDSGRGKSRSLGMDVGGREADRSSSLISSDHFAAGGERAAEHLLGCEEIPSGDLITDAGGTDRGSLVENGFNATSFEVECSFQGFQQLQIADPAFSKGGVVSQKDASSAQAFYKKRLDEGFRRLGGHGPVERERKGQINPHGLHMVEAIGEGLQEGNVAARKNGGRMSGEGNNDRTDSDRSAPGNGFLDDGLVATVHAIEHS